MTTENNKIRYSPLLEDEVKVSSEIKKRYSDKFDNSKRLNTILLYTLRLIIEHKNSRKVESLDYSIFLIAKLLEHHNSVQMLLKNGAITTSRAIVRVMIECKLKILALLNNEKMLPELEEYSNSEKRKLLDHILSTDKNLKFINWDELGFNEKFLNIPKNNKKLSIEGKLCKEAYPNNPLKEKGWYNFYRQLSVDVHSTTDSLNIFEWNSDVGDFEVSLGLLVETLSIADQILKEVFEALPKNWDSSIK